MSWCDKLYSVPSAGITLEPHFASGDALLSSVTPILNSIDSKSAITVDKHESFVFAFSIDSGFSYGLEHSRVYVSFQHRMRFRAVSGGLPVGELISTAQPYTQMLSTVIDRLVDVSVLLPEFKRRPVHRVGIVSTTEVDESDLPPGIARFISYLGRPWKDKIGELNINITSIVGKGPNHEDYCVHHIVRKESSQDLLVVKLDWQRRFHSPRIFIRSDLEKEMRSCEKASIDYFEDVAEGNRFDEQILSTQSAID